MLAVASIHELRRARARGDLEEPVRRHRPHEGNGVSDRCRLVGVGLSQAPWVDFYSVSSRGRWGGGGGGLTRHCSTSRAIGVALQQLTSW